LNQQRPAIEAAPTKDLFISMLVRDIELTPAIVDLVDNAVDGAIRLRGPSGSFDGLWVRLEVSGAQLRISDNCGGIPVDIARAYAFRFGRPSEAPVTAHSVGQFGVGMKRALFKLGNRSLIRSTSSDARFTVNIDVREWQQLPDWTLEFETLEEGLEIPDAERGTEITVTELHKSVAADLRLQQFQSHLQEALRDLQHQSIERGLGISLNGTPVTVDPTQLFQSEILMPGFEVLELADEHVPVSVRLFAGVGRSDPQQAGWYVYCNGRQVLGADQTSATGWGWNTERTIPKYHNRFAMFRGYAFFESDDSSLLPWTTTKTGVDLDSDVYRTARQRMIILMKPVIDFLYKLDREGEGGESGLFDAAVKHAKEVPLEEVRPSPFRADVLTMTIRKPPGTGRIQYDKPVEEINAVKKILKVDTYRAVGERTFDYFLENEAER
jgi:hypothetical protein